MPRHLLFLSEGPTFEALKLEKCVGERSVRLNRRFCRDSTLLEELLYNIVSTDLFFSYIILRGHITCYGFCTPIKVSGCLREFLSKDNLGHGSCSRVFVPMCVQGHCA